MRELNVNEIENTQGGIIPAILMAEAIVWGASGGFIAGYLGVRSALK